MAHEAYVYHRLALTLIFTVFRVDSCEMGVKEPIKEIWLVEDESRCIPCDVSVSGCLGEVHFTWHVFRKSSSEWLNPDLGSPKFSVQTEGGLKVKSFQEDDSGIYYCGVTATGHHGTQKQIIGNGTVVTVTALSHQIRQALLWLLFAVLALYSLIVLTLLILKMMGRDIPFLRGKCGNNNGSKNNSTRRRHFRAVLQELYSKRNLHSRPKTPGRSHSAASQFENPHSPTQDDDIYQNM
ncbi:uncharacterized protein si:ch211-139g16.8 [Sardina pilchardus]|uniref:uncharacterized protein si:ch211-139g16.8 n=1 Tax=Sardina pilchardus TaxID=27697 RepID=UPI002E13D5C8